MATIHSGSVTSPTGFVVGTAACSIKKAARLDLALLYSEADCAAAAVFTRNQVVAAPVLVDKATLSDGRDAMRAVVANAGNANACTGELGLENARRMQQMAAGALGCAADQVLVLSTGVIGVQLPMQKIEGGIKQAAQNLSAQYGPQAAQAIMTTDTYAKYAAIEVELPEGVVTIGGMAKGSGMIHPDMATLLGVLTTDAQIAPDLLDKMLRSAVNQSFNAITIDGDTSTNDTILILANGLSQVAIANEENIAAFQGGLNALSQQLAKMIVDDGEGASKFVQIEVCGAPDDAAAHKVAMTIATSPLVKTAFAGSDANWGRILAAAGRAGVIFDQGQTALYIGIENAHELQLVAQGTALNYQEKDAAAVFAEPAFKILLDLGLDSGSATVWTSDLTHEYISINADYRT